MLLWELWSRRYEWGCVSGESCLVQVWTGYVQWRNSAVVMDVPSFGMYRGPHRVRYVADVRRGVHSRMCVGEGVSVGSVHCKCVNRRCGAAHLPGAINR